METLHKLIKKEDYMKRLVLFSALLAFLTVPVAALASPNVTVNITAEKNVTVVKDGKKATRRVQANKVGPNEIIFYTVSYTNKGDEVATNAVVDDPIPGGLVYLPGSAFGEGADITFSIDGGKTYKKPSLLTYEITNKDGKAEKRTASPEEYTNIRWTIQSIPPGGSGSVGFKAKLK
jgi:uncharacterized repeat protein (TIGR01451 family)